MPGTLLADQLEVLPSSRSEGSVSLSFKAREGSTYLATNFQSGCLRARSPRRVEGREHSVILLNTAGGLAEGDRLSQHIRWTEGASANVTTQAAEKVYRALAEGCRIETRLVVGQGASAEWLPQETILFDQAILRRDCCVTLEGNARFLGVEAVILGRIAMGETVRSGLLRDCLRIYRNGQLIYADASELKGDIHGQVRRAAIGNKAQALALMVLVTEKAESMLAQVRHVLEPLTGSAAASAWDGLLTVRLLSSDGAELRRNVTAVLSVMRGGLQLPRSWSF